MGSMTVVVTLEIEELPLQIRGRPEERAVQTFTPNGANQPFHERMREWHVRHGLDVLHAEDAQIGLPTSDSKNCAGISDSPCTSVQTFLQIFELVERFIVCVRVSRHGVNKVRLITSAQRRATANPTPSQDPAGPRLQHAEALMAIPEKQRRGGGRQIVERSCNGWVNSCQPVVYDSTDPRP
jgi:hypothetical protein